MKNALAQIAEITAAVKRVAIFSHTEDLRGLLAKLDRLTADHTTFSTFFAMVHAAAGGYLPSLSKAPGIASAPNIYYRFPCGRNVSFEQYFAELDLLALCYDMAQEARGDKRRAFRV